MHEERALDTPGRMAEEAKMSKNTNTLSIAAQILAQNERLLALLEGGTTVTKAKPVTKAKGKKAKKVEGTPFHTLQLRLREHKAAGLVVAGVSVRVAQAEGLIDEDGNFVGTAPKAVTSKPASKKASSKKGKTEKVAAKVDPDAPAKVRAADGPRRADGSITPKSQWELREQLADSGKFDRHEIDAIVEPSRA